MNKIINHTSPFNSDNSEQIDELYSSLDLFRNGLNQHSIVATTDTRGTITYVNKKFCEISGYSRIELIGQNHRLLKSGIHPASFFKEMYSTAAKGGIWRGDIKNTAKNGDYYWVDTTIMPIKDPFDNVTGYLAIRTDITAHKETEGELLVSNEKALAAVKAKSNFLATMSHEIRTPMNGVLGMAELLLETKLNEDQQIFTQTISDSANSLMMVINDILDYSKIEAGKMELDTQPFDFEQLLQSVLDLLSASSVKKNIELLLNYSPELPKSFIGDAGRIRQIITNLTGNAVKFTTTGHVCISVSGKDNGTAYELEISVEDSGIGISQDDISTIFGSFSQADSTNTRKFGGTGLGLAIANNLSKLMGGNIHVSSRLGVGSVFTLKLQLPASTVQTQKQDFEFIDLDGKRALIVDDNSINCKILGLQLKSMGIETTIANSGPQALELMQRENQNGTIFDFGIIDFQMPEMSGLEFAIQLKQDSKFAKFPLILLTSVDSPPNSDTLIAANITKCITKPANSRLLINAIYSALGYKLNNSSSNSKPNEANVEIINSIPVDREAKPFNILIAEDNSTNRLLIKLMLEKTNAQLTFANNGQEAVGLYKKSSPDLVFMDISMPVMDGVEATHQIRSFETEHGMEACPIIALTANTVEGDKENYIKNGMDDYLSKPVNKKDLHFKMSKWLKNRSTRNNTIE